MSSNAKSVVVRPARNILGSLRVPGDKSISHRYAMLAALAPGRSRFENFAPGADCASTLGCVAALGCKVERDEKGTVVVEGLGAELRAPAGPLDCGNSGSTMRMLSGIVAAQPFSSELVGDESLSRRPMKRIMEPLTQMGAEIHAATSASPPRAQPLRAPSSVVAWAPELEPQSASVPEPSGGSSATFSRSSPSVLALSLARRAAHRHLSLSNRRAGTLGPLFYPRSRKALHNRRAFLHPLKLSQQPLPVLLVAPVRFLQVLENSLKVRILAQTSPCRILAEPWIVFIAQIDRAPQPMQRLGRIPSTAKYVASLYAISLSASAADSTSSVMNVAPRERSPNCT